MLDRRATGYTHTNPTPECEFSRISINEGALFTNIPTVTLSICSPYAAEMMISNDGGFSGAEWEPYATAKPWTLDVYGQYVMPRFVYAAFKDADGTAHGTYFDDIIYDPNPPEGVISVGDDAVRLVSRLGGVDLGGKAKLVSTARTGSELEVYLDAQDDSSGVAEMQLSEEPDFSGATWMVSPGTINVRLQYRSGASHGTVYVTDRSLIALVVSQ